MHVGSVSTLREVGCSVHVRPKSVVVVHAAPVGADVTTVAVVAHVEHYRAVGQFCGIALSHIVVGRIAGGPCASVVGAVCDIAVWDALAVPSLGGEYERAVGV